MGRPTKLTPERAKIIADAIAAGNYYETACALAGVDYTTVRKWIQKGEKAQKGALFEFVKAVKKAEAFAEAERIKRIREAAKEGNWQADAWWLERRFPERWGRKERQEISGPGGGPIQFQSFAEMMKALRAQRGMGDEGPAA